VESGIATLPELPSRRRGIETIWDEHNMNAYASFEDPQSRTITVVGAGFMGCVIATVYRSHGYKVVLCDVQESLLESFRTRAAEIAAALVPAEQVATVLGGVRTTSDLREAVAGAFLVQEAVQEDLAVKQELFARLDVICDPSVVLATNTSSFMISELCEDVARRDRVLGIHYVTPAHIVQAVELIYADFTPPELVEWGRGFLATVGHLGFACKERPAFIVNRLQYALLGEIYRLLDEGYATAEDIDAAVRLSIGPRLALWGPLMTEDLVVGKSTVLSVTEYLKTQTGDERYGAPAILRNLVADGKTGAISGEGWYKWDKPYSEIVARRDEQLVKLLRWLDQLNATASIGVAPSSD
jgi:3-hydroxybutyryl-CoA dehydrogenase